MADLKRMLICPYFGDFPPWMDKFEFPKGYDSIIDTDLEKFKQRVGDVLGIKCPIEYGSPKVWDYRGSFGLLYKDELKGYKYYGHCDFDMVFGDVNKWFPDEFIGQYDIISNHHSYVNGCFSLYSNIERVNTLFMQFPNWQIFLDKPHPNGWIEQEYSRLLEHSMLPYKYCFYQGWPYTTTPNLRKEQERLYQDGEEIAMFHFRRSKKWPL